MKSGTIKDGFVVHHTPRYHYISDRGPQSTGGEAVHTEIENSNEFNLENGDRVDFELTDKDTAVISKITEKKKLIVSLGQIFEMIHGTSDEYDIVDLKLHDVATDETGEYMFNYRITFHPKGKDYHKYITEYTFAFLIEVHKHTFEDWYEMHKEDDQKLVAPRARRITIDAYDFPNKNVIDFDFSL